LKIKNVAFLDKLKNFANQHIMHTPIKKENAAKAAFLSWNY